MSEKFVFCLGIVHCVLCFVTMIVLASSIGQWMFQR